MLGTLTVNGTNLSTYGLYVTDAGVYNAPAPEVQAVSIDGRNGDLLISRDRYNNVEVRYPAFIASNFATNVRNLRSFLLSLVGYVRIEDSFDTDRFRIGRVVSGIDVQPSLYAEGGTFEIVFNCKPQRFFKSGEETITFLREDGHQSERHPDHWIFGRVTNPGRGTALPQIKVYGSGTVQKVYVGGYTAFTITTLEDYIIVDSDMQDAFKDGNINMNGYINLPTTGVFPSFGVGGRDIAATSGVTKIEIIPRWWTL